MQCVRRVCIPSFIRHPIHSTSAVILYLRYDLTDEYRTVLCPRSSLFIPLLLLYNYDVREICYCIVYLFILCVFNDTLHQSGTHPAHNPGCIRHSSVIHPAHIRLTSGTQSILHPRSYYTFGTILPTIIEQSCARDIPLLFTFLLLYNYDVREICLMQYVFNNTLHQTHNLSNIRIIFYIFIRIYCIIPRLIPAYPTSILRQSGVNIAPYPSYIRHLIRRISVVGFHLRSHLTTIHDKSCARDLHFFTLLFHYYYFIFLMFERFDSYYVSLIIHCIIMRPISRTSCANPTSILHSSYINPAFILHQSCVYPAPNHRISVVGFHLRYDLTTIHDKSCTLLFITSFS